MSALTGETGRSVFCARNQQAPVRPAVIPKKSRLEVIEFLPLGRGFADQAESRARFHRPSLGTTFQGKAKDKRRSLPRLAEEINFTIVELHNAKGHGKADSRAFLLGREVELEDLVSLLGRYPFAGIGDADL